jgi:DNA-binding CsgD family transcriptional regulator
MRLLRDRRAPLGVVVAPRPSTASPLVNQQPASFVFVSDPEGQPVPPVERLRTLFRLTPMQAAFAREIARGDGIDAAAARLGVSRATARTHLAAVFARTRTSRQAELVRLLLRCAPNLRSEDG